jgi:hypothetical protein
MIHFERSDCDAAGSCQSLNCSVAPQAEVILPALLERMEKRNNGAGAGIHTLDLIRFMQTAMRTLQHEVRFCRLAALAARDHMIDVEERSLTQLR